MAEAQLEAPPRDWRRTQAARLAACQGLGDPLTMPGRAPTPTHTLHSTIRFELMISIVPTHREPLRDVSRSTAPRRPNLLLPSLRMNPWSPLIITTTATKVERNLDILLLRRGHVLLIIADPAGY